MSEVQSMCDTREAAVVMLLLMLLLRLLLRLPLMLAILMLSADGTINTAGDGSAKWLVLMLSAEAYYC